MTMDSGDFSLAELLRLLWRRRWLVLASSVLFGASGVVYALLATPWYEATVVVANVGKKNVNPVLSQLGGLASLAGINLGSGDAGEALAVLQSRDLASRFIAENDLVRVFAIPQEGVEPDVRDAVIQFEKSVRRVREDKKLGVVMLNIRWKDPELAAGWANALIQKANLDMRDRAEGEASRNLAYLTKELSAATIPSMQQAISRLIESEMQKAMLAKGSSEYAFRVIDPAQAPKYRYWPRRSLIVVAMGIIGFLLASGAVVAYHQLVGVASKRAEPGRQA
jgi:uncharacterized protein involved in exopolysaccharide biosynthesis